MSDTELLTDNHRRRIKNLEDRAEAVENMLIVFLAEVSQMMPPDLQELLHRHGSAFAEELARIRVNGNN